MGTYIYRRCNYYGNLEKKRVRTPHQSDSFLFPIKKKNFKITGVKIGIQQEIVVFDIVWNVHVK